MKIFSGVLGVAVLVMAGNALADDEVLKTGVFQQGWYVAPMFSYTKVDKERQTDNGIGGMLVLGHRSDIAAIELAGVYTRLGSGGAKLTGGELSLVVGPFFEQSFLARFFGVVGFGLLEEKGLPGLKQKSSSSIIGEAGLGYMQPFELFGFRLNARTEARYRYDYQQPPQPADAVANFQDLVFNLGLQIPLSSEPEPAPKPETVAVVPPVAPADADNDGVPDDRDKCPGTPAGATVDESGCERDSDGDGVVDRLDQCPDTPAGTQVDEKGCPLPPPCKSPAPGEAVDLKGCGTGDKIVLHGVNFEFDKSRLRPDAKLILNQVADALLAAPTIRIEIGGHTDGRGSADYNQKLSQRRAQAVADYLVSRGVEAGRMTAQGYGMSQPVASNDTDEGREQNRRVELKIVD